MNIESPNLNRTSGTQTRQTSNQNPESSVKFSDELKELEEKEVKDNCENTEEVQEKQDTTTTSKTEETTVKEKTKENSNSIENNTSEDNLQEAFNGLNSIVQQLNQTEDKVDTLIKDNKNPADNKNMINNDFNVPENKDLLPQMNPNMNFSGDGQPFSSFMNNESNTQGNKTIGSSAQDLAEEAAILSTMAENIAMANKNNLTVTREDGIKKVNTQTGITTETIVKFDSVIMNEADVEVFTNLVQNGEVNLNNLAPQAAEKAVKVSKTLADMLAKSMENKQPVRIDFDNNISVIIRISRDGKISADFLPSSQVAEAYLKENLPLLKQRFDENNIKYDELNHRERREQERNNNRKKDERNE